MKASTCFIVDDDPTVVESQTALLLTAGYRVLHEACTRDALARIRAERPDVVLADIMMPDMDGLELCRELRNRAECHDTKIIFVTSKAYEFDRKRALKFGADGFLTKPIDADTFVDNIGRIVADRVDLAFWGVRGTLPVPGERSLRYGGNTSCVSLEFPKGQFFIFDAGSGIKSLSDHLRRQGRTRLDAKIFISHPHWDHINALPFFQPLYTRGNEFEICGASHGDTSTREMISAQMDNVYFPITLKEFGARVYFRDLREETIQIDGITVRTMLLCHPGHCLGYRVDYKDRSVCYITDNELYLESHGLCNPHYERKLARFCEGADALITDSTYTDEEYLKMVGWGHSSVGKVVQLAHEAGVKTLHLFHHDPDQGDDDIDAKLATARTRLEQWGSSTRCVAPAEGMTFKI